MDNVETVKDLEKYFDSIPSLLTYVEDPKIFQFPNQIKLYKGDTLVIEVRKRKMPIFIGKKNSQYHKF